MIIDETNNPVPRTLKGPSYDATVKLVAAIEFTSPRFIREHGMLEVPVDVPSDVPSCDGAPVRETDAASAA